MENNLKESKNINFIWQNKKYTNKTIGRINQTNNNNNINITNY